MSATVFATEPGSRLTDEAIAPGIPVIVTVAVIVCIRPAVRGRRNSGGCSDCCSRYTGGGINRSTVNRRGLGDILVVPLLVRP